MKGVVFVLHLFQHFDNNSVDIVKAAILEIINLKQNLQRSMLKSRWAGHLHIFSRFCVHERFNIWVSPPLFTPILSVHVYSSMYLPNR